MSGPEAVGLLGHQAGEAVAVDGGRGSARHRPIMPEGSTWRQPIPPAATTREAGATDVVLRPRRCGRGAGARMGRTRSGDRVGPSMEVAGEAADLAMSDAARGIDGEIAGAAVGAAVRSVGGGRAAPQTAGRYASARDRHGRGARIQFLVLTGRASRGRLERSTRRRDPGSLSTVRIMRTGARLLVSYPERGRERVALYRRFASADR